jgi:DNA polymerase-3 subunit beta
MKYSVVKNQILEELQLLQGIVEKRNTMPILANILMDARPDRIELTGTDLEVGLRTSFEARVEEEGSITVSGKKIFEIVKSLPEECDINFKENDDLMLEISAGKSHFKILCLPKEDYPQVPDPKFEKKIILPMDKFREMIDRVYYAIAQEQRYYLNGALMILKNNAMELVSTDGHRLSHTAAAMEGLNIDRDIRVIVAKKTLGELRKIVDGRLEFDSDDNNLFFKANNRTLISRIIESKFPNFEAVIPKENPNILTLEREEFTDAIRRVSLLSAERSRGIKFTIKKKQVELFSSNPEMGDASDRLDVEYKGPDLEIGFNSQYLIDFLTTVNSERVRFELKDENSAALLKPEIEEEIKYSYVLMPMKI